MKRATLALTSLLLLASLPRVSLAEDATLEAQQRFEKGVVLFKAGDYEGALVEFRAAYKAKPHFAVRYNVGITLYKLHRYGEASQELQVYFIEGKGEIPKAKLSEVKEILSELESLVGSVDVTCGVEGAEILVDGEVRDTLPLFFPLQLDVGEHDIEVHAEGYRPFSEKVEVPGGRELTIDVELEPSANSSRKKLKPTFFWSGVGLTSATILVAVVTGSLALKKEKEYDRLVAEDDWKPVQRSARNLAVATDALWVIAGTVAATSVILAIFTDFYGHERAQSYAPRVSLSISFSGLSVMGVFQ